MKKLIPVLIVTFIMSTVFIACGPSAEEKAMMEQQMKDSIAAVEKAQADSLMAVQQQMMADSMAAVKAVEDSLANIKAVEDSLAAVKSSRPRKKPAPAPTVPQVGKKKPGAN